MNLLVGIYIGDWLGVVLGAASAEERLSYSIRWARAIAAGSRRGRLVNELARQLDLAVERGGTRTIAAEAVIARSNRMQERLDTSTPIGEYWLHGLSGLRLAVEMVVGDEPPIAEWAAWVGICAVHVTFVNPDSPPDGPTIADAMGLWFGIDWTAAWQETFEGLRDDWSGTFGDLVAAAERLSRTAS